jgi:hypothetical protein
VIVAACAATGTASVSASAAIEVRMILMDALPLCSIDVARRPAVCRSALKVRRPTPGFARPSRQACIAVLPSRPILHARRGCRGALIPANWTFGEGPPPRNRDIRVCSAQWHAAYHEGERDARPVCAQRSRATMPVPEWTDAEVNAALACVEAFRAHTGPDFSELAEFGCRPASFVVYMTQPDEARRASDHRREQRGHLQAAWLEGLLVGIALAQTARRLGLLDRSRLGSLGNLFGERAPANAGAPVPP